MNRRRSRAQLAELARELSLPRRANPVLALWHWRYELAIAALVPPALIALDRAIGPVWLLVAVGCVVNTVLRWPAARRFVTARGRTVVVQHRLRTAFRRARVCTLDGRRPAILLVAPRDGAIRVLLFCPAGVDVDQLREQRRLLAAACFATDVVVARHPRWAHLVVLSVRTAEPDPDARDAWTA